VPALDVGLDGGVAAQQRIAEPAAAAAGREVQVAGLHRVHERERVLLDHVLARERVHLELLVAAVDDRVGLASLGLLVDVRAEHVVHVGARRRVAAEQAG
jgi:hypothetical protein